MTFKKVVLGSALLILWTGIATLDAQAQQYVFRSIDVPGAGATTFISNNNNAGAIGVCYQAAGFSSDYVALLLANAAFKVVKNPPNGISTCPFGLSNNGKVVGAYEDKNGKTHGFLLVGKTYTSIDHPGAVATYAQCVNNSGTVCGYYNDGSTRHGFTWNGGTFTGVDFPGASETDVFGINDSGAMVGAYRLSGVSHGFQLTGNTFTTVDYPGASFTSAFGINNSGHIVGFYYLNDGINHAFVDASGSFSTLDYPGSLASAAIGINDVGQIVGDWFGTLNAYDRHGYLATPIPGKRDAERGSMFEVKGPTYPE
jgi:probable HAF family extracellular repeat protein